MLLLSFKEVHVAFVDVVIVDNCVLAVENAAVVVAVVVVVLVDVAAYCCVVNWFNDCGGVGAGDCNDVVAIGFDRRAAFDIVLPFKCWLLCCKNTWKWKQLNKYF